MGEVIALLNIKTDRIVHPLSLLYVGSALKRAGFDVKIYNIPYDMAGVEGMVSEVLGLKPLFVGVSVFTGIRTAVAAKFSKRFKELSPSTVVVWGGVHPSLVPQQCLEEDFIDIAAIGEGEETAVELAEALSSGTGLNNIKGIGYKANGKIILNEARPLIENLDNFPLDWSLINADECIEVLPDGTKYMEYMSSRGCPFNCGFCYNRAYNKRRWRPHSFRHTVDEILRFRDMTGVKGVVFFDDNFMVDTGRAFQILKFLKDKDIQCVRLMMRLDLVRKDILDTIVELGIRNIFVGFESGSNRVLKLMNKGITREEILEKFKLLSKYPQIAVSASAVIGFPTETWDEICQTADLGVKIAGLVPSNIVTLQTFLPYPGTDLYSLAVKEGFNPPRSSLDWAGFNTFYGDMKLEWLPWANKKTQAIFYRLDKYAKLLNHGSSTTFLRTLAKNAFYLLAKLRLKYRFFGFPFEIFILHRFNRYYRDFTGKVLKR